MPLDALLPAPYLARLRLHHPALPPPPALSASDAAAAAAEALGAYDGALGELALVYGPAHANVARVAAKLRRVGPALRARLPVPPAGVPPTDSDGQLPLPKSPAPLPPPPHRPGGGGGDEGRAGPGGPAARQIGGGGWAGPLADPEQEPGRSPAPPALPALPAQPAQPDVHGVHAPGPWSLCSAGDSEGPWTKGSQGLGPGDVRAGPSPVEAAVRVTVDLEELD